MGKRAGQIARAAGVAALGLACAGMGALGGGGRDAGLPTRDYAATLTDVDGTRIDLSRVSVGGDQSLEGDLGRGRLRIPFDRIARVTFEPAAADRDRVRAALTLRDGEPVTLTLRTSTTFYGQTASGAYSIRARDLRSVEFRP